MKYTLTYDLMESARNTNQWLGATARAIGSYPAMAMTTNPAIEMLKAWGEVTERTFERMVVKPDWGIPSITGPDGKDHPVKIETLVRKPFGDLIRFTTPGRKAPKRKILLVAPMSGHYATLLRKTVISLLPDCDVHVTDWHNARDIPASEGKFDVEDYTQYLVDFMRHLGSDLHVIAVCQPAPLTLAATAMLAEDAPNAQPRSLTLIGGPIDPDAAATDVTDFGSRVTMGQLEHLMIQRVSFKYKGVGREVYPGLLQLASFIGMNGSSHAQAFTDQIFRVAQGEAADHDKHNTFYDEYLAVMDMTAEFYLSTVERVFKEREIARNAFVVNGRKVDIGKITKVAVKVVEGEKDDISAPGQCLAALDLLTGLPDDKKAAHLEPGAGHYGIFAGGSWRNNIRPLVLAFIDANADAPATAAAKGSNGAPVAAKLTGALKTQTAEKPSPKTKPAKTAAAKKSASAQSAPKAVEAKSAPKQEASKPAATQPAAAPQTTGTQASATGNANKPAETKTESKAESKPAAVTPSTAKADEKTQPGASNLNTAAAKPETKPEVAATPVAPNATDASDSASKPAESSKSDATEAKAETKPTPAPSAPVKADEKPAAVSPEAKPTPRAANN